ncbi:hypothetical protein C5E45_09075 [Nocardia nova]|uniref:Uncharacterized protein n=1 Tax=Nocardia nova TaxID=37330 RepID=A0A2S6AT53_9NOCA|nr:hypothetical protein C5E41_18310 [Nocardia nova]PPJ38421.1 hypothetical protein C5E45_09075 [Nocardia nova]
MSMALQRLTEERMVDLDEERRASMVSNLLVVPCGDRRPAQHQRSDRVHPANGARPGGALPMAARGDPRMKTNLTPVSSGIYYQVVTP